MKKILFLVLIGLCSVVYVSAQRNPRATAKTATSSAATTSANATEKPQQPVTTPTAPPSTGNDGGVVVGPITDQVYTGVAFTPDPIIRDGSVTLVKNKDYTINYANNVNVGVATVTIVGKGNYRDTKEIKFNITPKSINQVMINPVNDQTFRNSPIAPDIQIKDGVKVLVKDTDYTLTYNNNLNVGTASVTITGKGNYKDAKTLNFRIVAKSMSGKPTSGR